MPCTRSAANGGHVALETYDEAIGSEAGFALLGVEAGEFVHVVCREAVRA